MEKKLYSVTCRQCGKKYTLAVYPEDVEKYKDGMLIQKCFPYLSASERELLISETCESCWNKMFPDEE